MYGFHIHQYLILKVNLNLQTMKKISAFINKLSKILSNEKYHEIISWEPDGQSFQIHSSTRFIEKVLPQYFKHSNMASFIRQLNMYGFTRHGQPHRMRYWNPYFRQNHPQLHELIVRKNGRNIQMLKKRYPLEIQPPGTILEPSFPQVNQYQTSLQFLKRQHKKLLYHNRRLTEKLKRIEVVHSNLQKYSGRRAQWKSKEETFLVSTKKPFNSNQNNQNVQASQFFKNQELELKASKQKIQN